jgi:hypothetical protein
MKVSEFIEWLQTKDQDMTVEVIVTSSDWCWNGEDEVYSTTVYQSDFTGVEGIDYSISGNTICIGSND